MINQVKLMPFDINIKKKDLKMAKYMFSQFGGPNSELAAAIRYFNQSFNMPDVRGRRLLFDIFLEEVSHINMIGEIIKQLVKDATVEERKLAGMDLDYSITGIDFFPQDPNGYNFTTSFIASVGDPISNLYEDMAAEQKARSTYEHLIDLCDDKDVINVLLYLRQREVVHFNRFKELLDYYLNAYDEIKNNKKM